jgi:hypothetical protein
MYVFAGVGGVATVLPVLELCVQSHYLLDKPCILPNALGVELDSKLHFQAHIDYIFSQSERMLGLILNITYSFSTPYRSLILYLTMNMTQLCGILYRLLTPKS